MGEKKKLRLAEAEAAKAVAMIADTPPHGDEATEAAVPPPADPMPVHPEELRASVTLRIGDKVSLSATARATPAGLIASALIVTAAMVPLIWISRRR